MTGAGVSATGATGLRRFVKRPPPGAPPPGFPPPGASESVRADPGAGQDTEAERCEMCREVLDHRRGHGHVVDTDKRSLACTCRACYLLFTHEGAAAGRYRAVPRTRVRHTIRTGR